MLSVRIYVLFVVIVIYAILRNIWQYMAQGMYHAGMHRKEMNVYRVTPEYRNQSNGELAGRRM